MSHYIIYHHNDDSVDRPGFLTFIWRAPEFFVCFKARVPNSCSLSHYHGASSLKGDLSFVRISDNYVGFNKPTNPEVTASASLRTWLIHAHTIQDHVTLESSEPCEWRVTGNIQ
jgi:hypothetical protein